MFCGTPRRKFPRGVLFLIGFPSDPISSRIPGICFCNVENSRNVHVLWCSVLDSGNAILYTRTYEAYCPLCRQF